MKINAIEKHIPSVYKRDAKKLEELAEKIAEKEYFEMGNPTVTPQFMVGFQHLIAEKVKLITEHGLVDKMRNLDIRA